MTKRQLVNDIEDWGRILNQIFDMLIDEGRPIMERIGICHKTKKRMIRYWLESDDELEIIWRMRWERIDRYEDGLMFAMTLDVAQCLL